MTQIANGVREAGLLERILARIETWARGSELDRMNGEDLRSIAHDIGLDPADLARLAQGESDASRLLYARLGDLGLSMADIESAGIGASRDMERTCAFCADRGLCEHDLSERPDSEEWRKVCPNNAIFEEMERRVAAATRE
ncbi:MAG: hypothetical protein AB7O57_04005 [Hyphomicrobiaceae bacterium]